MPDARIVKWISQEHTSLEADLDERDRRRWAAAEARSLGPGGIAAVAAATGVSDRTIRRGIPELDDSNAASSNRQRQPEAGRKSREVEQPKLKEALDRLVSSGTHGDPMSPLRWTCKSTRTLATELQRQGFQVISVKVGHFLNKQGLAYKPIG